MSGEIIVARLDGTRHFYATNKEEVIDIIMEEYHAFSVCIGEILDDTEINGLSINDVVDIYAKVIHKVDGDKLIHKKFVGIEECRDPTDYDVVERWDW